MAILIAVKIFNADGNKKSQNRNFFMALSQPQSQQLVPRTEITRRQRDVMKM